MRSAAALALLLAAAPVQADFLHTFNSFVSEHLEQARSAFLDDPIVGQEVACHECTERIAKHVTEIAMAKMEASCKLGQGCPHACKQLEESPKVMLGVTMVKLKPVELAEMFCAGRGKCTKQQLIGQVGFHATAMSLTMEADKEDFEEVLQKVREMEGQQAPDAPHEGMGEKMAFLPRPDPECMHNIIEKIMSKVVKPQCDGGERSGLSAKACMFSEENPEVFRGMMLGKVEPWKYAAGYCAPREEQERERHFHPLMASFTWAKRSMGDFRQQRMPTISI